MTLAGRKSATVGAALACFLAAACIKQPPPLGGAPSTTVTRLEAMPAPRGAMSNSDAEYRIGSFDLLVIDVFGVKDLAREARVDAGGNVAFPLIGTVQAAGRTPAELASDIGALLRQQYIRNPQVSVNVKEAVSQVVTVDGEVKEPGLYPVLGSMSLMQAVARAGGTSELAKLSEIVVFRQVGSDRYVALYDLQAIRRGNYADPRIYASDIIIVGDSPERRRLRDLLGASSLLATPLVAVVQQL